MLKKIMLVNPNFTYFPGWLSSVVNYKSYPLGLAYLAAYVKDKCPVEVKICDASTMNLSEEEVLNDIRLFMPDIIGITTTTLTIHSARNIASKARNIFSDTVIVFGGPHVTALPDENLDMADICVIGEGEETFCEIVKNFIAGKPLRDIKGIAYKEKGANLKKGDRKLIEDLDTIPFPSRGLLPPHKFRHIYPYRLKNPYYDTILTSRGCSYNCHFCLNELMWNKTVRHRTLDNVFQEIKLLIERYKTSLLFMNDDNFIEKTDRVLGFCEGMKEKFPGLKWICHGRADGLTLNKLKEMESAGCVEIQIGVESGEDKILAGCNKKTDTKAILAAFKLIKKTRINCWATFILGNIGETGKDMENTIKFAKKIDPAYATFMFLSPLPGTKCFDYFLEKKYIKKNNWAEYTWHGEPVFETESLSRELLVDMRKKAYKNFYLRPRILFRYLCAFLATGQWETMLMNLIIVIKFMLGLIKDKNSR